MTRRGPTWPASMILGIVVAAMLLPLAWTTLAALGLTPVNGARPPRWVGSVTLDNFIEIGVLEPAFWQEIGTSIASSAIAATAVLTAAVPAAWVVARTPFRGREALVQATLVLAALPAMAFILPLQEIARLAHLAETFPGLVIAQAGLLAPLAFYVLVGVFRMAPVEQEEAAALDGAGTARLLLGIVLPGQWSAVAGVGVVAFVQAWNMLLVPLVLAGGSARTISVALVDFFWFERELDWPVAAAAVLLSLLPLAAVLAVAHRAVDRVTFGAGDQGL